MDSLFSLTAYTVKRAPKARKTPDVAPVRFAGGFCNAACMFALGPDCDCPCLGRNHQKGFQCESVQEEIEL